MKATNNEIIYTYCIFFICLSVFTHGQVPQAIPYQAVVRDNSGNKYIQVELVASVGVSYTEMEQRNCSVYHLLYTLVMEPHGI